MGGGIFGAEFDLSYTPKFYGAGSGIESSGVMTMMGSLIIGISVGAIGLWYSPLRAIRCRSLALSHRISPGF